MDLNAVIKAIDSGQWLSMSIVKCNVHKNVAGAVMHLGKVRVARGAGRQNSLRQAQADKTVDGQRSAVVGKNPHHAWNFTRNLETPNGSIISIHPLFVFTLNGKPVQ